MIIRGKSEAERKKITGIKEIESKNEKRRGERRIGGVENVRGKDYKRNDRRGEEGEKSANM